MLKRIGCNTDAVTPAELLALQPFARVDDIGAAAYEPDSGYANPAETVEGFRRRAQELGARIMRWTTVTKIQAPRRRRSNGSNAVTKPPGLRFQLVVPSGNRSMSIGSRLATTTKSDAPETGLFVALPPAGGIYTSIFAGPMPSMDRNIRHSSASVA